MGYKRAEWHSGFTYEQVCGECRTVVRYTDHALDFRPWFADGFVYCPKCKSPIRHHERYAIDAPDSNKPQPQPQTTQSAASSTERALFCSKCGKKFSDDDNFCSGCGTKR